MGEKSFEVGDVLQSEKFVYGYRDQEGPKIVYADGQTKNHLVWRTPADGRSRSVVTAELQYHYPEYEAVDLGAYDPGRASARFVVEDSRIATVPNDQSEPTVQFYVRARRLDGSGNYDPAGECIQFFTTGVSCRIDPADIRIVAKMKKVEVYVPAE